MLLVTVGVCLGLLLLAADARGQINSLTRDEMIKYTAQNPYDRFPDGRPKVPDALIEKLKAVSSSEELMQAVRGEIDVEGAHHSLDCGARVVWCERRAAGGFQAGMEFAAQDDEKTQFSQHHVSDEGADHYETLEEIQTSGSRGVPPIGCVTG